MNFMKIKVTGIQLKVKNTVSINDKEANILRAVRIIERLPPTDLIALPELFTIGYGKRYFQYLPELADSRTGPLLSRFQELARKKRAHLIFGFPEKAGNRFYNSVAIIDATGRLIDVYRKMHVPGFRDTEEKDFFRNGTRAVSFDVKGVNVGVIICYDIRFPEITRKLALHHGVDFLIHPVGFFRDETFSSWPIFTVTRAIENQIFILSLNRAGKNNGGSFFCPPFHHWKKETKFLGSREAVLQGIVDTEIIRRIRNTYRYRKDILKKY